MEKINTLKQIKSNELRRMKEKIPLVIQLFIIVDPITMLVKDNYIYELKKKYSYHLNL